MILIIINKYISKMSLAPKRKPLKTKIVDGFIREKEIALMPIDEELDDDISVIINIEQISSDSYFVASTKSSEKSPDEAIYAFIERSKK